MSGYAFNKCYNLNTLEVDKDNPYFCSVNNYIFNKNMTTLLRVPVDFRCEDIPNRENIQHLGEFMMSYSRIKEFIGWPNVTTIGVYFFHSSHNLRLVDISMTKVTSIPIYCFCDCMQLNEIHLPANVTYISRYAFTQLFIITTIYIPLKVDNFEDLSFIDNPRLKNIVYFGDTSFENRNLIRNCPMMTNVRVTTTYPSSKFGYLNVKNDAYIFGSNYEVCQSLKLQYSSQFSSLIPFVVFILM